MKRAGERGGDTICIGETLRAAGGRRSGDVMLDAPHRFVAGGGAKWLAALRRKSLFLVAFS